MTSEGRKIRRVRFEGNEQETLPEMVHGDRGSKERRWAQILQLADESREGGARRDQAFSPSDQLNLPLVRASSWFKCRGSQPCRLHCTSSSLHGKEIELHSGSYKRSIARVRRLESRTRFEPRVPAASRVG